LVFGLSVTILRKIPWLSGRMDNISIFFYSCQ
jgi:hypothetical protein